MKILPKKPEVVKKDSDSDEDFKPPSKSNLSKLKKLFDDDDDENEVDQTVESYKPLFTDEPVTTIDTSAYQPLFTGVTKDVKTAWK